MRVALLAVVGLVLAAASVEAQPTPGAWIVRTHEIIDSDVEHAGEIVIVDGGILELRGTLTILKVPPYEPTIRVQAGGAFLLNGTTDQPARLQSRIVSADPMPPFTSFFYKIKIEAGGLFQGKHCDASGAGTNQIQTITGNAVDVAGGEVRFEECVLHDGFGIVFEGGTGSFFNVSAWNSGQIIRAENADLYVRGLKADEEGLGLRRMKSAQLHDMEFRSDEQVRFSVLALLGNGAGGTGGATFYISNLTIDVADDDIDTAISATAGADVRLDGAFIRGPSIGIELSNSRLQAQNLNVASDSALVQRSFSPDPIRISDSHLEGELEWNGTLWLKDVEFDYDTRPASLDGLRWEATAAVQVVTEKGHAVVGVPITAHSGGTEKITLEGVTDGQGRFEFTVPRGYLMPLGSSGHTVQRLPSWTLSVPGASERVFVPERGGTYTLIVPDAALSTDPPPVPAPLPLPVLALALAALAARRT